MVSFTLSLALASLAAASPLTLRQTSKYAPISTSTAIKLIVNVTDLSRDFPGAPAHGQQVIGIHAGAGIDAPTISPQNGIVWFANGSSAGPHSGGGSLLVDTDGPTPYGLRWFPDVTLSDPVHGLAVQAGPGTPDFQVTHNPRPCPVLWAPVSGTFAVCDTGLNAPEHPRYQLDFVEGKSDDWYHPANVPDNCVAVTLVPQCDTLRHAQDAPYPIDYIWENECYEDVGAIQWSQYSPCW